jgi:hypothetical protein
MVGRVPPPPSASEQGVTFSPVEYKKLFTPPPSDTISRILNGGFCWFEQRLV